MKTVLILANSSAGLYDFRNEFILRLLTKYKVVVSLPDLVKTKELEEEGCQVVHTQISRRGMNPLEDLALVGAYRRLLREVQPDLVLTYTIKPNIYGGLCCRMQKIPYISTITGLGSTFMHKGAFLKLIVFLYRMGLRGASCVFFQNQENRAVFEQYHIGGKTARLVSGSGVNLRRHRMEPYPKEEGFRFLFVGRMMKEKGIEEFLAAARQLHNEQTVFRVLGYCDEDYQDQLDQLEAAGVIEQLGFQTDVHDFLAQASALVLPTYHEGMSNVLMEASSTGRPVLASNISGCREIFTEGETGLGFAPGDAADLVRALKQFMTIPMMDRAMMGRRGREKMGKEFDRERVCDAYVEEVEKLIQ